MALQLDRGVALAPRTTLELGGTAEHFAEIADERDLVEAARWAAARDLPLTVLGGGSNVIVDDDGVPGLVIAMATRGIAWQDDPDTVRLRAAAGERWDDLVARAVDRGLWGIECLAGIPGSVGATPIQNVGAYGQEIADVLDRVRVLEPGATASRWLSHDACGFGYRTSVFKRERRRDIVLEVELVLRRARSGGLRHGELARALPEGGGSVAEVRDAVLALRRAKSMVIDPHDENRRSVGSFFTNPIVDPGVAADVAARASRDGVAEAMPSWPMPDGRIKLAAAWLIERSGTRRGERHGAVGVSSRHTLALVHHGGGTTAELLALADAIARRVFDAFGVVLEREPVRLGGRADASAARGGAELR